MGFSVMTQEPMHETASNHRLLLTLRAGLEKVTAIAISPDGKRVAASGKGGLKIWELPGKTDRPP